MSRVAKQPIQIPAGVTATVEGNTVRMKGGKGELSYIFHRKVSVTSQTNDDLGLHLAIQAKDGSQDANAQAGTTRANLANNLLGVTSGFQKKLSLVGVGYRAALQGNEINFSLGFSHPTKYKLPEGVKAEIPSQTEILLTAIDNQLLGQVAAEIRSIRPPESYKGKGVRYADERIILKETKKK